MKAREMVIRCPKCWQEVSTDLNDETFEDMGRIALDLYDELNCKCLTEMEWDEEKGWVEADA